MPQALPYIAVAAAGIGAASSISQGIAQGHAANYQAQVAANNAKIAQQNAEHAASAGAADTLTAGLKARAKLGSIRTGYAANNLDVNTGSPADVQVAQRQLGALDTATVAHNAALSVYGYKTQATGYQAQSGLDKMEAGYAPVAGVLRGVGQLAGAVGDFPTGGGKSGDLMEDGQDPIGSLISGPPSPSSNSAWMWSPDNSVDPEDIA